MVDEYAQVLLNLLVDSFRLPIRLRMVRRGGIAFDAHQFVEVLHEPGLELGASIVNDLPGDTVQSEDVISINLCHAVHRQGCLGWNDMYLLGESVHHHANGIVP